MDTEGIRQAGSGIRMFLIPGRICFMMKGEKDNGHLFLFCEWKRLFREKE